MTAAFAANPPTPQSGRAQIFDTLSDLRELLPPQSIQRSQAIRIGGM